MASYDRQFEVVQPKSLEELIRVALPVATPAMLNPNSSSPVPIIDGEFVQVNADNQFVRATDADNLSFAVIDWRGDYGIQASGKLTALGGGTYWADTIVFDPAVTTIGTALKIGTVNDASVGGVARAGLVAQGGSGLIVGHVVLPAAKNGGRLRFIQTAV